MALGESNKVLYNGQWVTYEEYWKATGTGPYSFTDKNATYSPAPTQFVDNNKPVVSTNNPNNPFETVKDNTPASEQKAADNGFSEDLQILRATRQDNGEIAFQVAASKEANNLGVITQYGNTKTSNLTARQKAQLEAYIKAHPEQQTAPSKKIKYYNAYGMPVYDGEQDPLDLTKSDPFASGDQSLAETQQDDVTNSAPLVITFGYAGKDQSMGLLMPDTMVYPITNDVKTIYPSKIPLSMEEDPRNGLYAVGFEGTVQNVIFLDPGTGKFYSKFLSKPTPAYDIAVFSRDSLGMKSGTEFVNAEINEHETEILLNPLNKDWVKNNVKLTVNKPEGYKPVRVQSPEEMAATPKLVDVLGVPSDSAFARSMDPDYNAKKLQAIEFTERAQSFGQQFSLSMIPLPNFIAKPIGMGVSKVVGVVEKAPVVGGALSSINKFMAISPGDVITRRLGIDNTFQGKMFMRSTVDPSPNIIKSKDAAPVIGGKVNTFEVLESNKGSKFVEVNTEMGEPLPQQYSDVMGREGIRTNDLLYQHTRLSVHDISTQSLYKVEPAREVFVFSDNPIPTRDSINFDPKSIKGYADGELYNPVRENGPIIGSSDPLTTVGDYTGVRPSIDDYVTGKAENIVNPAYSQRTKSLVSGGVSPGTRLVPINQKYKGASISDFVSGNRYNLVRESGPTVKTQSLSPDAQYTGIRPSIDDYVTGKTSNLAGEGISNKVTSLSSDMTNVDRPVQYNPILYNKPAMGDYLNGKTFNIAREPGIRTANNPLSTLKPGIDFTGIKPSILDYAMGTASNPTLDVMVSGRQKSLFTGIVETKISKNMMPRRVHSTDKNIQIIDNVEKVPKSTIEDFVGIENTMRVTVKDPTEPVIVRKYALASREEPADEIFGPSGMLPDALKGKVDSSIKRSDIQFADPEPREPILYGDRSATIKNKDASVKMQGLQRTYDSKTFSSGITSKYIDNRFLHLTDDAVNQAGKLDKMFTLVPIGNLLYNGIGRQKSRSAEISASSIKPNIASVETSRVNVKPFSVDIPTFKPSPDTRTGTISIPIITPTPIIGDITKPKPIPDDDTKPKPKPKPGVHPVPPIPGHRPPPIKMVLPGAKIEPFKVKKVKGKGTYTYKNNIDALLGAMSGPSIGRRGGKNKKKGGRLLP